MPLETINYIGSSKILSEKITDETTPSGVPLIEVTFDSENVLPKKYPETLLRRIITEEPIDATAFRALQVDYVVNQMIVLLQDNDIEMTDFKYLMDTFVESLDHKNDLVIQKIFGIDNPQKRTFLQIEKIINAKQ